MKTLRPSSPSHLAKGSRLRGSTALLAGLLLGLPVAQAEVKLTFDTNMQGVVAGSDATSTVWSNYGGGCLALTVTAGWRPSAAFVNLNDAEYTENGGPAPALLEALRDELKRALVNGGTISYKVTVETDAYGAGPYPGWFQTIYQGRSYAGWDQALQTGQGQLDLAFNGAALPAKVEYNVVYPVEAASTVIADARAQFRGDSPQREIHLGLNAESTVGSVRYYIDDFKIAANAVAPPVEIPKLTITPAVAGLNVISSGTGQYDRQTVRTREGLAVSWIGGTFPKTYELTIAGYPTVAGYESVIYFVPDTGIPATNSNPDYSQPVCAGLWIYPNGDGTGSMALRYKDSTANSNGPAGNEYWIGDPAPSHGLGGQLAAVSSTTMLGTWKITFTSDTEFVLTSPDGSTSSGAFKDTTAAKFAGSMYTYFGNVPGQVANIGLSAVYSRVKITGAVDTLDENLAEATMSGDLQVAATVPASVLQVTPDIAKYWLNWTLPATDFQVAQSADLGVSSPWEIIPTTTVYPTKIGRSRLLLESEITSPDTNFFRLVKPGTP